MNKELILKYKAEFDAFLQGKSVLCTDWEATGTKWRETSSCGDDFTYTGLNPPKFIINDEYVKFRCALAEGKEIQYLEQSEWQSTNKIHYHALDCSKYYRIKPDEPKLKVGDWVRETNIPTNIKELKEDDINSFNGEPGFHNLGKSWELWEPQPGEWCWFWGNHQQTPKIANIEIQARKDK